MFQKQFLQVYSKVVAGLDAIKHILQIAEVKVEFAIIFCTMFNPSAMKTSVRLGYNRKTTVPNTGVMGQVVAHDYGTLHPTFKDDVLGEVELSGDAFLDGVLTGGAKAKLVSIANSFPVSGGA